MNEDLRAASPEAAGEIFKLRSGFDAHNEKRRSTGSANEIKERAIARNELVLQKAVLENLFGVLTPRPNDRMLIERSPISTGILVEASNSIFQSITERSA